MTTSHQSVARPSSESYGRRGFKTADYFAISMAATLPWSTTAFAIFAFAWVIALAPTLDVTLLIRLLKRPLCALPVALFCLAVVGMAWSEAPWDERVHSAGSMVKLLALPLLVYQFQRSEAGIWTLGAFFGSCSVLLFFSWLNWFDPRLALLPVRVQGVPVKNWITQSQEFVLCMFGAVALAVNMWRSEKRLYSFLAAFLCLAFLFNMIFVVSSRTALLSIPLLVPVLTVRYINVRWVIALLFTVSLGVGFAWVGSSYLRMRIDSIGDQYKLYVEKNEPTSAGQRLEYWRKSVRYMKQAPVIGAGTGSIKRLFEKDAVGKSLVSAVVVANPHNQTLYFGIQWGILGITILFAMWIVHFLSFTEMRWISWIGLLVVTQNILGSTLNSHISDSVEGWLYVMGVGVIAGLYTRCSGTRLQHESSDKTRFQS